VERLSLGAEYGLSAVFSHRSSSDINRDLDGALIYRSDNASEGTGFDLNTSQLGFAMTYYF
jgi:hypothetical protein